MQARFEAFIRERSYVQNVSPRTIEWYKQSLTWLGNSAPTADDITGMVVRMREAGLKASSCNNRLRAVKAYVRWAGLPVAVPKMQEPNRVLPTFGMPAVSGLIKSKPKTWAQHRLHCLVLLLLDVGARIDEALSLQWSDVDFDNLLVTLHGKGSKDRVVPFSYELRKVLYRWKQKNTAAIVFPCVAGHKMNRRNVLRDVKLLCKKIGVDCPERTLHSLRHTFASNYIQSGGGVVLLQRILGHSSLSTTMRYVHIQTADLSANHERSSLLNRR